MRVKRCLDLDAIVYIEGQYGTQAPHTSEATPQV